MVTLTSWNQLLYCLLVGTWWASMQDNMLLYLEVSQWIINDGLDALILLLAIQQILNIATMLGFG